MCHDGTATKWAICHAADEDEAIEGLLARLRDALEDDPALFRQGWPEACNSHNP